MGIEEFQQLILRRTLQAVVIGCSVVLFVILLTLIQSSLIWLPCDAGCPIRYIEFVQSMTYLNFEATQPFFDSFFFLIVLGVTLAGFRIFRTLTSHLRHELYSWAAKQEEQQRIAVRAAFQQHQRAVIITHDGELVDSDSHDTEVTVSPNAPGSKKKSQVNFSPERCQITGGNWHWLVFT